MKKLLLLSASCLMLLSACKKDANTKTEEAKPEEKKYDVTFSVADFEQGVKTFSTNGKKTLAVGDTLKNYADNFYYRIYNASGVLVNTIDQASSSATFGVISDKLPSGTYNVFFAAAKGVLYTSDASTNFSSAYFRYNYPSTAWSDNTYSKQFQLTVGTTATTQSVRLDRAVGALDVTLTDAIPSNAAKISIIYQSEMAFLYQDGANGFSTQSTTKDFALTAADYGVKNKKFTTYIANTFSTSNVVIRAYDANNGLLNEKTVQNVRCYKNQRTTLTGTIFPTTSNVGSGFTVVVNPIWSTTGPTPITF